MTQTLALISALVLLIKVSVAGLYLICASLDNFVKIEENKGSDIDEDNLEESLKNVSNIGTRGSDHVNKIHKMYEKVDNKNQDPKFTSFKE